MSIGYEWLLEIDIGNLKFAPINWIGFKAQCKTKTKTKQKQNHKYTIPETS